MTKFLEMLLDVIRWSVKRPRLALEAFLILALVAGGWAYNRKTQQLDDAQLQKDGLEADLSEKIKFKDNELIVLRREKGKVKVIRRYVPQEGYVVIKKQDQAKMLAKYNSLLQKLLSTEEGSVEERARLKKELEEVIAKLKQPSEIEVKDKGFTFKPGWGLEVGQHGFEPRLDIKWAYWKRWSALVGGSKYGLGAGVSRHIDDITWGRFHNAELFAGYKVLKLKNQEYSIGIRTNF